ncbi:hypothetical protein [Neorhizobium galegae]|uniref:hypothetical protein n=1 Tax=Neorhizobium galegae TaxID=399 RepID=UPI0021021C83|nr:hypothetical protein [Neorhizobium galegae]MCQ1839086.1 hypothetical protein [Neorhizobium galegae]
MELGTGGGVDAIAIIERGFDFDAADGFPNTPPLLHFGFVYRSGQCFLISWMPWVFSMPYKVGYPNS